jgi:flagellum-specific peptidoglycan hydrolase FlgJ
MKFLINLLALLTTFVTFNAMVNYILYDNATLLLVQWKYNPVIKDVIDAQMSIYDLRDDIIALKNKFKLLEDTNKTFDINDYLEDNVSLDEFKQAINNNYSIIDTTYIDLETRKSKDLIKEFHYLAEYMQLKYNIPASITFAQMILETGWGTSPMFKYSNQCFGRKCFVNGTSHWKEHCDVITKHSLKFHEAPHCNYYPDDRKCNRFVNYNNYLECADDRYKVLMNSNKGTKTKPIYRYRKAFNDEHYLNYKAWANILQEGGYATSKDYSKDLIKIIKYNKLYRLDKSIEKIKIELMNESKLKFKKHLFLLECKTKNIINSHHYDN